MPNKDRVTLDAQIDALFADNNINAITPDKLREMFRDILDSFQNKISDAVPVSETLVVNLVAGANSIAHSLGKTARFVNFKGAGGINLGYPWSAVSTTGISVTTLDAINDVTIEIIAYN